jgi:hypothetical protein
MMRLPTSLRGFSSTIDPNHCAKGERPQKPFHSLLFWALVLSGPVLILLFTISGIGRRQSNTPPAPNQNQNNTDRAAIVRALDDIATPQAFAAQCGKPEQVIPSTDDTAIVLSYAIRNDLGRIGTERVIIQQSDPKISFSALLNGKVLVDSADNGLAAIGCKLPEPQSHLK